MDMYIHFQHSSNPCKAQSKKQQKQVAVGGLGSPACGLGLHLSDPRPPTASIL